MTQQLLLVLFFIGLTFAKSYAQSAAAAPRTDGGKSADQLHVQFDKDDPNIVTIVSNGERYKLNVATKSLEKIDQTSSNQQEQEAAPQATAPQDKIDLYAYESGEEPFDYRLVNVPTPKKVPKGTWNLNFTHRFAQPLRPLSESAPAMFGLDSMSVSSFGITYGITDKFYVNAYRSPLCQRGLCRDIEVGFGYHFTDQDEKSPLAISAYASVEGNDNFTEEYTYNLQAMFSRRFGRRVFLFFSPAVHLNANGQRRFDPRPDDYFPPAMVAETFHLPTNGMSFGFGGMVRITPSVSAMAEFTPRTGFKLGRIEPIFDQNFNITGFNNVSHPEIGLGVQYSIGKHAFTLTFSNTQTTTTSRYNSSNLVLKPKDLVIGFNLFRRW